MESRGQVIMIAKEAARDDSGLQRGHSLFQVLVVKISLLDPGEPLLLGS